MTNRLFLIYFLVLACIAAVLVWMDRYTDVNLYLADVVFDFAANEFPWRQHWFFATFMHHVMKALMIGLALVSVTVLLADAAQRQRWLDRKIRRQVVIVIASSILIPLAISLLKSTSIHHCPWSFARYGGFALYLRIFDSLPPNVTAGHCFPAGHASSGLWIASIAVFWLPEKPERALLVFGIGLIPALILGWAQQMRGAHFLSHTLWSTWTAALIILILTQFEPCFPSVKFRKDKCDTAF